MVHALSSGGGGDDQGAGNGAPANWLRESPEELEEITEDLRARVENWHGLDFSRYVFLLSTNPPV